MILESACRVETAHAVRDHVQFLARLQRHFEDPLRQLPATPGNAADRIDARRENPVPLPLEMRGHAVKVLRRQPAP